MKLKKKVERAVKFQVAKLLGQSFYFAGLTALIPLVPLLLSPDRLARVKVVFGVALALILAGFLFVYWFSGSKRIAFKALGFTTLVPGLLAVLFSYLGPRRMAKLLRSFGEASPFLESWIETYVPKAWLLAGIYIILGVWFVWISYKVKN